MQYTLSQCPLQGVRSVNLPRSNTLKLPHIYCQKCTELLTCPLYNNCSPMVSNLVLFYRCVQCTFFQLVECGIFHRILVRNRNRNTTIAYNIVFDCDVIGSLERFEPVKKQKTRKNPRFRPPLITRIHVIILAKLNRPYQYCLDIIIIKFCECE